jgi:hypothetical protein
MATPPTTVKSAQEVGGATQKSPIGTAPATKTVATPARFPQAPLSGAGRPASQSSTPATIGTAPGSRGLTLGTPVTSGDPANTIHNVGQGFASLSAGLAATGAGVLTASQVASHLTSPSEANGQVAGSRGPATAGRNPGQNSAAAGGDLTQQQAQATSSTTSSNGAPVAIPPLNLPGMIGGSPLVQHERSSDTKTNSDQPDAAKDSHSADHASNTNGPQDRDQPGDESQDQSTNEHGEEEHDPEPDYEEVMELTEEQQARLDAGESLESVVGGEEVPSDAEELQSDADADHGITRTADEPIMQDADVESAHAGQEVDDHDVDDIGMGDEDVMELTEEQRARLDAGESLESVLGGEEIHDDDEVQHDDTTATGFEHESEDHDDSGPPGDEVEDQDGIEDDGEVLDLTEEQQARLEAGESIEDIFGGEEVLDGGGEHEAMEETDHEEAAMDVHGEENHEDRQLQGEQYDHQDHVDTEHSSDLPDKHPDGDHDGHENEHEEDHGAHENEHEEDLDDEFDNEDDEDDYMGDNYDDVDY